MRGFDEQLRFLDEVMRGVRAHAVEVLFVGAEQVSGEFALCEAVEKELRVVQSTAERAGSPLTSVFWVCTSAAAAETMAL